VRIIETRRIEDCFDGSTVQDCLLDGPMTDEAVRRLGALGHLQYFTQFPRPLFVVNDPLRLKVKGLIGNTSLRCVVYTRDVPEAIRRLSACLAPDHPSPTKEDPHATESAGPRRTKTQGVTYGTDAR
jgi:hypothetical protein